MKNTTEYLYEMISILNKAINDINNKINSNYKVDLNIAIRETLNSQIKEYREDLLYLISKNN